MSLLDDFLKNLVLNSELESMKYTLHGVVTSLFNQISEGSEPTCDYNVYGDRACIENDFFHITIKPKVHNLKVLKGYVDGPLI